MFDGPFRLAVSAGLIGVVFELAAMVVASRSLRRLCYMFTIPFTAFAAAAFLAFDLQLLTVVIAFTALFRILNAMRATEARMKEPRLRHATRRTSWKLLVPQAGLVVLWLLNRSAGVGITDMLFVALAVALLASLVFVLSVRRTLIKTQFRKSEIYHADAELPSVSVCIPARNETEDLPACLSELIKSDYPKLEILVLDDCSQDRTSEIIKGFAHDGVRFIAGEPPKDGWLAKNQAYQALAEAASGEILLFCGVDTRFGKSALRTMVGTMISRKKQMISVLPQGLQTREHALLVQPMRYWWELALPRRLFNRPPVLSTVWMISRQAFFGRGEMKAVKSSILPEGYFARELTVTDEYSFMRSSGALHISTAKKLGDQWQSAIRTRYPRLRRRPENVYLITLLQLWLFALPIGIFVTGFFVRLGYLWLLAGLTTLCLIYVHRKIMAAWGVQQVSLALALFPLVVVLEVFVTWLSMWRYEFSRVDWKGRDICIPVMRHYKQLPKL